MVSRDETGIRGLISLVFMLENLLHGAIDQALEEQQQDFLMSQAQDDLTASIPRGWNCQDSGRGLGCWQQGGGVLGEGGTEEGCVAGMNECFIPP